MLAVLSTIKNNCVSVLVLAVPPADYNPRKNGGTNLILVFLSFPVLSNSFLTATQQRCATVNMNIYS